MSRPRRAPLALLLALLLPGVGGSWLALAHPCPAALAVTGGGQHEVPAAAGHHGHDGSHSAPAQGEHGTHCQCLGACQGGAVPLAPAATELASIQQAYVPVAIARGATTWFAPHTPLDFLPPPTAPPASL